MLTHMVMSMNMITIMVVFEHAYEYAACLLFVSVWCAFVVVVCCACVCVACVAAGGV